MGNGTKITLVALLILMVVVIARFVREGSNPAQDATVQKTSAGKTQDASKLKIDARQGQRSVAAREKHANVSVKTPGVPRTATPADRPPLPATSSPQAGSAAVGAPPSSSGGTALEGQPRGAESGPSPAGDLKAPVTLVGNGSPGTETEPPRSVRSETVNPPEAPKPPVPEVAARPSSEVAGPGPRTGDGTPVYRPLIPPTSIPEREPVAGSTKSEETTRLAQASTPGTQVSPSEKRTVDFPKKHKVQPKDSFYRIARVYYGKETGGLVELIKKANPGARMWVGDVITVPAPPAEVGSKPEATAKPEPRTVAEGKTAAPPSRDARSREAEPKAVVEPSPALAADRLYEVKRGDTLWSLAKKFYGDSNKQDPIIEANPQHELKYRDLIAGTKLKIPAAK